MYAMLAWNPQQRPSSHKALAHRFFTVGQNLHRMQQKSNNKPIPSDILDKNHGTQETVKPINLNNMSLNKNFASKKNNMDFELKMLDGSKKVQETRKRWGSSKMNHNGANGKESMNEFDSILDGLGSSTNSFNKRVRFFLLILFVVFTVVDDVVSYVVVLLLLMLFSVKTDIIVIIPKLMEPLLCYLSISNKERTNSTS